MSSRHKVGCDNYRGGSGSNQAYGKRQQNNNAYSVPSNIGPPQQQQQARPNKMSKPKDSLTQFMQMSITNQKNIDASIKNLEVQVGELAKQFSEHGSGSFSANISNTN